jgi:threonine efflux protein
MTQLSPLLLIAGVYLAVLASPGPNFFILSQMALDGRQRESRYVVLGLTTGSIFWVVLSLAGMSTLMAHHPWLASAVRFLGASYLVWYGASLLWRAVARPVKTVAGSARRAPAGTRRDARGAYRAGLLTGITNPKGAAFWTSVFATLVPAQAAGWFYPATILMVAVLSLLWHFGITVVFGAEAIRARYLRVERWVDGVAGGMLVMLGVQRIVAR